MRRSVSLFCLLFLFATALPAAAQQTEWESSLTDKQKLGRRLFLQRCGLCHTPLGTPNSYGPYLSKERVENREEVVRSTIMEGREGLMPGFKHTLSTDQIDAIMDFLKVLPERKAPQGANQQDNRSDE